MRRRTGLGEDQRGAAYVEFLIAFIPLFVLFMGMVQMALMYAGDLVVQHAATRAARAAVVVLDDDPQYYEGASRRQIDRSGTSSEDAIGGVLDLLGGGGASPGGGGGASGGPRISAIRRAASMPLMAISPSFDQLMGSDESVRSAVGSPESRAATGALAYNDAAMGITFPAAPRATSYRSSWPPSRNVQVTTRVTYLFHCGVPLANRLMCETYPSLRLGPAAAVVEGIISDLGDGSLSFDEAMRRLRRANESRRRHERDEEAIAELESAGSSDLMYLTWATGSRFKVLRGEATMPLQYASYCYPGGGC
jgi:hypothetical protein